jgi:hypothetical protein
MLQFALCELWPRPYTKYLQLRIIRPQYSTERNCAAIRDISTIQCALQCKLAAQCSACPLVYAIWTVDPRYTMQLQFRIFRLQYSAVGICAAVGDIPSIQWELYSNLDAEYSAHPPVYAVWTVVPVIYNAFTAPYIQSSIFIWTYLRCNWRYLDNWMGVKQQTWCQI